jgi:rubrerythrin
MTNMTPLHLSILIHYYSCANDYEMVTTNEVRRNYADQLCDEGYLHHGDGKNNYEITEQGKHSIEQILRGFEPCNRAAEPKEENKSNLPEIFYTRGWICPVCGAGLNPAIAQCPCIYSVGTITIGGNKIDSLTITGQSEGISIR